MKEQSHKAEMSAALRGDFERLRARGVSAALVPQDELDEEPPIVEPSPNVVAEAPVEAPVAASPDEPEGDAPARRGWLSRLAGR